WTPALAGVTNEYGNRRPDPSYGLLAPAKNRTPHPNPPPLKKGAGIRLRCACQPKTPPKEKGDGDRKGVSDHAQRLAGAGEGRDGPIEIGPVMASGDLHADARLALGHHGIEEADDIDAKLEQCR